MIKDSGDRTQFNTGAVRDMHTGKGRMDLLPVTAILELSKHCEAGALKYGERNVDKGIPQHSLIDSGLRHLFKYLRGDFDEKHLVAAAWNIMWALNQEIEHPELNDLPNREAGNAVKANMSQLKNNGWIPCSERLPKDGENVILHIEGYEIQTGYRTNTRDGECFYMHKSEDYAILEKVIAWQPLPPAYIWE